MLNNTTSQKKSGNKCGHNPKSPRHFSPPKKHANRPKFLKTGIERVKVYNAKPSLFPTLNAANGSDRQQRSERRESCAALLSCIMHYTDLATFLVGIPQADGSMQGLTMPYLAEKSELSERRTERAIRDLKRAGFVTVYTICEKIGDTVYKGVAAIRAVNPKVFTLLGLDGWLRHERKRASEKKAKREAKRNAKAAANLSLALGAQRGKTPPQENTTSNNGRKGTMSPIAEFLSNAKERLKPDTS